MSFGRGGGDVFAISALAIKVFVAYQDAPENYRHISEEVAGLQVLLGTVEKYFKSSAISSNDRQNCQRVLKGCQSVLEDLNSLIEKYSSLASTDKRLVFKRVKLGKEDIITIRQRLISNTVLLSGFVRRFVILFNSFDFRNSVKANISTLAVNILKFRHG